MSWPTTVRLTALEHNGRPGADTALYFELTHEAEALTVDLRLVLRSSSAMVVPLVHEALAASVTTNPATIHCERVQQYGPWRDASEWLAGGCSKLEGF